MTTLDVTARWEGGYRCHMRIRQYEVRVDEPVHVGGTDTGLQPTELLLASVASCFTLAVAHVAKKRRVALTDLSVTATGEYDGPRFRCIVVRMDSTHPAAELAVLARLAVPVCYVSNTLRGGPEIVYRIGDTPIHEPSPGPAVEGQSPPQ